jgi:sec-independent protein translocase protein TatA
VRITNAPNAGSVLERLVGPTGSVAYMNLGITELLIVLLILVILFGAVKLPKLARSLGRSRNEFKRGLSDEPEPDDHVRPPD